MKLDEGGRIIDKMKKEKPYFVNYKGKKIQTWNNRGIWTMCIILIIFTVMMLVFGDSPDLLDKWEGFK